ncbi:MAG: energy transducer TonB [Acidobacteriota bacterium]
MANQNENPPKQAPEQKPLSMSEANGMGDHLDHLLPPSSVAKPLYLALYDSIKEIIHPPPPPPPLVLTSKPYVSPSMRGLYGGNEWKAGAFGIAINATIIALLLLVGTNATIQQAIKDAVPLVAPILPRKPPPAPPKQQTAGGGGGGGAKTPDTKGQLPKIAPRTFVPPTVNTIENPKLSMPATIVAGPDIQISANNLGDPFAGVGLPSNGTGVGNGIGPGKGNGVGPGSGGGFGGGALRIGGGVSSPVPILRPEPEYSEEARKAKHQGEVQIQLVVDETGHPQEMKVIKKLGLGLDEKALEAVSKWTFKPGMKDGKPVRVIATVAVTFRLL